MHPHVHLKSSTNTKSSIEEIIAEPFDNNESDERTVNNISPIMCTENEKQIETTQSSYVPFAIEVGISFIEYVVENKKRQMFWHVFLKGN